MLEVRHVRKQFTKVLAVRDISFDVQPGQVFGLIGPNGAGKSTTIRMVMDIIKPDTGEIRIDGSAVGDILRNMTGYLPEERGLYKKSRVDNVLTYFAALKGVRGSEALRLAYPLLERFDLLRYRKSSVEELSKGNQQKLQFVVSVLHHPKLLVLDELFSGLDPVNQEIMKEALLDLKQDNRAIVFSTHQMDHAEKLCDDLILIDHGEVVLSGPPHRIKREHGQNTIRMEYTGDAAFLSTHPDVVDADIHSGVAEVVLRDTADFNSLLHAALDKVQLSSFARVEPSLHRIFLDTVGATPDETTKASAALEADPVPAQDRSIRTGTIMLLAFLAAFLLATVLGAPRIVQLLAFAGMAAALLRLLRLRMVSRASRQSSTEDRP